MPGVEAIYDTHLYCNGHALTCIKFFQSLNTPHFAKVKDFINLQMPSGFPIKFGKQVYTRVDGAKCHILCHFFLQRFLCFT